ncbi:hypothetical protein PR048_022474 [Dryococelus australis]|uniref:Uncharacterized protein n=1 Tax=Dryococelus australis TaxID=614101 RepID=A0ABQ9H129_9NEOP|nr:hypothetical protein PR048_022474 [Dryococelus australis]
MTLASGFSLRSPVSLRPFIPALLHYSPRFTLIGSQDLNVRSPAFCSEKLILDAEMYEQFSESVRLVCDQKYPSLAREPLKEHSDKTSKPRERPPETELEPEDSNDGRQVTNNRTVRPKYRFTDLYNESTWQLGTLIKAPAYPVLEMRVANVLIYEKNTYFRRWLLSAFKTYTQCDENTARQFGALRLAAMSPFKHLEVSPLSLPHFSTSNGDERDTRINSLIASTRKALRRLSPETLPSAHRSVAYPGDRPATTKHNTVSHGRAAEPVANRGGENKKNGCPAAKPADQRHLPARFPDAKNPGVTPARNRIRFALQVEIVPDDPTSRRVISWISRFPRPCIPVLLHSHLISPSSALKTSVSRAAKISHITSVNLCLHEAEEHPESRPLAGLQKSWKCSRRLVSQKRSAACLVTYTAVGDRSGHSSRSNNVSELMPLVTHLVHEVAAKVLRQTSDVMLALLVYGEQHREINRFGLLLTSRSREPMRVIEMSMEQRRNERTGETGEPRENPQTNVHDPHVRKSGVTRPGIEPRSPWWEASGLTAQPPWPHHLRFLDSDRNKTRYTRVVIRVFFSFILRHYNLELLARASPNERGDFSRANPTFDSFHESGRKKKKKKEEPEFSLFLFPTPIGAAEEMTRGLSSRNTASSSPSALQHIACQPAAILPPFAPDSSGSRAMTACCSTRFTLIDSHNLILEAYTIPFTLVTRASITENSCAKKELNGLDIELFLSPVFALCNDHQSASTVIYLSTSPRLRQSALPFFVLDIVELRELGALNNEFLRANEGEVRRQWSSAGMRRKPANQRRRPALTRPGIEQGRDVDNSFQKKRGPRHWIFEEFIDSHHCPILKEVRRRRQLQLRNQGQRSYTLLQWLDSEVDYRTLADGRMSECPLLVWDRSYVECQVRLQ